MYSPFTLFADACAPDAANALAFNAVVNQYLENKNVENRAKVTGYLNKWIALNKSLIALGTNAHLVQPILPLAKSLSAISEQLALVLNNGQSVKPEVLIALLEECNSKNHADVELAVYDSLKKLL